MSILLISSHLHLGRKKCKHLQIYFMCTYVKKIHFWETKIQANLPRMTKEGSAKHLLHCCTFVVQQEDGTTRLCLGPHSALHHPSGRRRQAWRLRKISWLEGVNKLNIWIILFPLLLTKMLRWCCRSFEVWRAMVGSWRKPLGNQAMWRMSVDFLVESSFHVFQYYTGPMRSCLQKLNLHTHRHSLNMHPALWNISKWICFQSQEISC